MITNPQKIEEHVIQLLQRGALNTVELIAMIRKKRPGTSKQGVYQVLQKLHNEEVVVLHGNETALSSLWLQKITDFFLVAQQSYHTKNSIMSLAPGEKISYSFQSLQSADEFISHAYYIFATAMMGKGIIYVYNPHEWFHYARPESDKVLYEKSLSARNVFLLMRHDHALNRAVRKKYHRDNSQCHILDKEIFGKDNYYFNVFGNIVLEFFIDKQISARLDKFFQKYETFSPEAESEIKKILHARGKNRLIISHNPRKATKLSSKFHKYFYIK